MGPVVPPEGAGDVNPPYTHRRSGVRLSQRLCSAPLARLTFAPASQAIRLGADVRKQTRLAGLDLEAEISGVYPALGEAAGDEPEPGLSGAREHAAQLLSLAKPPDWAD